MRSIAIVLVLAVAHPAVAEFDAVRALARSKKERRDGLILTGIGAAFSFISFGGLVTDLSASACGGDFGGYICAVNVIEVGSPIFGAGAVLAIPLVTAGVTLYRVGVHDATADPPRNRRGRGRSLAIVGAAMTAAAAVLGGLAIWYGYDAKPYDNAAWATTTVLGVVHGTVGLGLLGGGLALYSAAR